jgi:glutathione S-transferase
MLTVHHLGISQSERIVWLCEELEIPYELKVWERDPVTRLAPEGYKALHPLETAPIIEDDDIVLAESGAIMDYILARYGQGRLVPAVDDPDFVQYLFWYHFGNGSMMPAIMVSFVMGLVGAATDAPLTRALLARTDRAFDLVEARLGQAPWLAGTEFSAADIMMGFPLTTMRYFAPRDLTPYPNIRGYLQRVGARPAYQRAMAKGDPGMVLLLG